MNSRKWMALLLIGVWVGVWFPAAGSQASDDLFYVSAEKHNGLLEVTVHARQVSQLYAYDLVVEMDPDVWALRGATSGFAGFTVGPLLRGREIQFAHTLIGKGAGMNGEIALATFRFERIAETPSELTLKRVQLVDEALQMTEYLPKLVFETDGVSGWRDTRGHWAEAELRRAAERNIAFGYDDGTFRPDRPIDRAEWVAMLARALHLPEAANPELTFTDSYSIPEWARPYVAAAFEKGIVAGYKDGTLRGGRFVTREELATIVARAFHEVPSETKHPTFSDHRDIAEWARPHVEALAASGIVQGKGNNRFAPQMMSTRAEAVVVLLRALEHVSAT